MPGGPAWLGVHVCDLVNLAKLVNGPPAVDERSAALKVARCHARHYACAVILRFRHKGLERLFTKNEAKGVQGQQAPRLLRLLDLLDAASVPADMEVPGLGLHPLKGEMRGRWALKVSGNWRLTFRFEGEDVTDVDLEDYH